ncbi:serine hydrolase domain-containing protein [Pedobacter cryoconitis]|uniref:CubicO group peptidase (Beta-lactamase class C family) n=1 Tax=Pedobacter cryoconitis TaxID=188932 RepID=A0A7X0MIC2_9SPHI|nr:serine hydrolase [Pedobacter cryoconitis]MBB6500252.1 CubicO group peptidase (beta-lactamase class C family) [Pedobacter cryoconitis]
MTKNNLLQTLAVCILAISTFSACAQQHQKNEDLLKVNANILQHTVLLNNQDNIIPLTGLEKRTIASVSLGFSYQTVSDSLLNKYAKITSFSSAGYENTPELYKLEDDLKYFNTVIVSIPDLETTKAKYINFINTIAKSKTVIIALYGQQTNLQAFDSLNTPLVWAQDKSIQTAALIPQMIFGGIAASNKLTRNISGKYTAGSGYTTTVTRLKYTIPEDAGVNSDDLNEIDNITAEAIGARAAPGMVVLVAKDGKVIFNKAYGNHTYGGLPEKVTDIFDLASVTKITATTPMVMRLVEENKLKLDTNIGAYIALARPTAMNDIPVRDVMLHQAGFIPYIPFHDGVKATDHSPDSSAAFPTKVADGYFIRKDYFKDVMWPQMLNAPIRTRGKYVYSDISMYVMKDIVEHISGEPLNIYVAENFYAPLGMQTAGFLPRNRFSKDQIIPTENDTYFRKTLLIGYVHDQGAALVGGVSGHAGLFASSNDMAIMYQMLLNKGSYGGQQYFKPQTVETFTAQQSNVSRRGLGFDRWDPDLSKKYPSATASPQTYGHTGYTGTAVWVDQARGLVYVFLSNRVNPTVTNKLVSMGIRSRIEDVINKAIDKGLGN